VLPEGDELYRLLFDASPEGVIVVGANRLIKSANQAQCRMFRYDSPEEMIGLSPTLLIIPAMREYGSEIIRRRLSGEEVPFVEHRFLRKDGSEFWGDASSTILRDANGLITGYLCITRDTTERKRAETYREIRSKILQILNKQEPLRGSIQRILAVLKTRTGADAVGLRLQDGADFPYFAQKGFPPDFLRTENTLLERGADGGVCRDRDGNICLECTCGLVISGKTDPSNPLFTRGGSCWTNDSFPLLDLPSDQDPRLHPRNRCIHLGYASVALVPIRRKDQIVGLLQLNSHRKGFFSLTAIEQLESIAAHLGEALLRKHAEEVLRESEERYRSLFENSMVAISRASPDGRLIGMNPAYARMYGYASPEQMIAEVPNVAPRYANPEDRIDVLRILSEKGIMGPREFEVFRRDGMRIWVEVLIREIRDAAGKLLCYQASHVEVTERKRAEEELRASHEQYRALAARIEQVREEERAALARELHDELGQGLTALQIDLAWLDGHLRTDGPTDLPVLRDKIAAMVPQAERLIETTQAISSTMRPGVLDDLGLVATIEWLAVDFEKRTGLPCVATLPAADIALDLGLAVALFRIIQEALTNVIRHAKASRVEIRLCATKGELALEVEDNGRGIIPRQIADPRSLGLFSMRERAAALGGTVDFRSEAGRGTIVSVRAPMRGECRVTSGG
jgi:PAS domain S-box-containing protein